MSEYRDFVDAYASRSPVFFVAGRRFHSLLAAEIAAAAWEVQATMEDNGGSLDMSGFLDALIPRLFNRADFWSGITSRLTSDPTFRNDMLSALEPSIFNYVEGLIRQAPNPTGAVGAIRW